MEPERKNSAEREELIAFRTAKRIRQHKGNRVLYWLLLVMTLLVSASAVYSLIRCILGSREMLEVYVNQIQMCVLALICLNIPVFFQKRLKVRVPDFICVIVYLFIFIHFILGEIYRFYDSYALFDKTLHTVGGAVIAFIGFSVVLSLNNLRSGHVRLSPFSSSCSVSVSRFPSSTFGNWWNMRWMGSVTGSGALNTPPTCSAGKTV